MREKTFGTILANIQKTVSVHGWVYCSNERVNVCWRTMIFSISLVSSWGNLYQLLLTVILVFRAWMPSSCSWHISDRSFSWKCQKWSLDLIVVMMASSTCQGIFWLSGVMVPLLMRVWRVCLSLPSNIILSCFQTVLLSSACLASMLRASR